MEKTINVMLVEDDPNVRRIIKLILERLNTCVKEYEGPIQALEVFCEDPDSVDLVISDLLMPDLSGLELLNKMRSIRPCLTVALTSGAPVKDLPANCFLLQKPFTAADLTSLLELVHSSDSHNSS